MRDSCFARGNIPMTKHEVRAVSLAKLALFPGAVLWDVGAGTGSVSIEAGQYLREVGSGAVYAVEREPEGVRLIRENRARLLPGWEGIKVICGRAPEALSSLPAPTHVFIGGSGGNLHAIIRRILDKNREARIVVNAVTAETLAACLEAVEIFGFSDHECVQVAVSRLEQTGRCHMYRARNPVHIIRMEGAIRWS